MMNEALLTGAFLSIVNQLSTIPCLPIRRGQPMRTRHKELSKNPKLVEAGIVKLMVKKKSGAGDGTRTRDSLLGRQELYH